MTFTESTDPTGDAALDPRTAVFAYDAAPDHRTADPASDAALDPRTEDLASPAARSAGDVSRRTLLTGAGALGAAALLSQLSGPGRLLESLGWDDEAQAATASCVLTPSKTEGPYFVDEHLTRSDIRVDTSDGSVQTGVPLTLKLVVVRADGECAVVPGAVVDIWHANAKGTYSDVNNMGAGGSQVGKKYLRGNQTTADDGSVSFTTIYPGWYSGRAIHIHFKVRLYDGASKTYEFTSQMFFDPAVTAQVVASSAYSAKGSPDTSNASDNIYGSDGAKLLVPLAGSVSAGYTGTFVIGVSGLPSTTTTTTTGSTGSSGSSGSTGSSGSNGSSGSSGSGTSGSSGSGTTGSSGSGSSSSGTTTTGTTSTNPTVDAALSARAWRRGSTGRRYLRLTLQLDEPVDVSVRVSRTGALVAKKKLTAVGTGKRTVDLAIPARTARGKASLTVTFTDDGNASKTITKTVTIPKRA